MKKTELLLALEKLKRAFDSLKKGVDWAETLLEKDGVIQRFEYTFELFWKTLKLILRDMGIDCYSPKSCIKEAFRAGFLKDDEIFLDMLEDRKLTSHIYDEATSEEIFERIKKVYAEILERAINKLEEKLKEV